MGFSACTQTKMIDISEEPIETFEVNESSTPQAADETKQESQNVEQTESETAQIQDVLALEDKLAQIDFYFVSGVYSRSVLQESIELIEMFSLDKNSFVRIATGDMEQEVYAYNYYSGDFTYMYYFEGELLSKTILNVETGAVLQDEDDYASLLTSDADELKEYFFQLIELGNISLTDLLT